MFSVGSRREEKMTKNGLRYQTKQNGVKPAGPEVRAGSPREQYRHHHHHYQHHPHVGGDGGAAYETSVKKGTQQQQQVLWRTVVQQQRTLGHGSYGSSGSSSSSNSSRNASGSSGTDRGARPMTPPPQQQRGGGTPTTTTTTPALQQQQQMPLWTLLPKDLVEKVFAFLPLHSLFQARCVCKCWKSVGFSNNLVKLRAEAPVVPPYYPVFLSKGEDRRWCAYDHVQQKWLHLPPLTFLPKEAKHILAGDGGLLCLSESPSSALNLVCNPITRVYKKVPSLSHDYEPGITHMVVNGKNQGFQMIVTLTHYRESTHVFESRHNSWQATSCLPAHFLLWGRRSSAFCEGFLYCVALEIGGMNMEGLIAYDVESGVWTEVHELPRGMRDEPYVLACGGRVLVVAAQKNANGRLTSIRIVEFDPVSKQFKEVTEMPQNVMLDVFKCRGGWKPVAFGDRICVASKKTLSVAVYDMVSRSWHELPKCPLTTKVDVATFCYGPSLQSLQ